jgi:type III pantothenate kinase
MLCFDIGNTNIVIGAFTGDQLVAQFRLKTEMGRTIDEYSALVSTLLEKRLGSHWRPSRAVICSVVPPLTQDAVSLCQQLYSLTPLVIGPGVRTGIKINVPDPTAVGADRIVNAVAARELFGAPSLVVDFGTATTFDVVSAEGAYEGGVIAPGASIAMEALVRNTAKLPSRSRCWEKIRFRRCSPER